MKEDKKLWLAILVLIGLVAWLIILSLRPPTPKSVNKALKQIQQIQQQLDSLPTPTNTTVYKLQPAVAGPVGPQGIPGQSIQGPPGKDGTNGVNGTDGQSAYQLWLSIGNTGTVTDFLNSLHGEDGASGREVQLKCDSVKLQNEWRYVGDSTWRPLDKVQECASD